MVRVIGAEGTGMITQTVPGCWSQITAGGRKSMPSYNANPAWQLNIAHDQEVMFRVTVASKDPEKNEVCILAQLYRVNQPWPIKEKLQLSSLHNASLSTHNGVYTYLLSPCITEKKKLEAGVYVLVASTYEAGVVADFNVVLYTQQPT